MAQTPLFSNTYCRTVRTKRLHISIKSFYCSVSAIQSYCPQNKPSDLPLCYWRPVHTEGSNELSKFVEVSLSENTYRINAFCQCEQYKSGGSSVAQWSFLLFFPIIK